MLAHNTTLLTQGPQLKVTTGLLKLGLLRHLRATLHEHPNDYKSQVK